MLKNELEIQDLKQNISRGTYAPYSQLPSISQLCEQYGVSKITINKALDALQSQGLISRRRGSGTFVKKLEDYTQIKPSQEVSGQMEGFLAEHTARGEKVHTKVYVFEVERPSEYIAHALDINQQDFVYRIIRVRYTNDIPLVIEYTYMPIDEIPNLKMTHLNTSIYSYIEHDLGLKIANAHRVIRAVLPTAKECKRLNIENDEPMLEVEQIGYLDDGRPFEYSIARHAHGYEFLTISTH